MTDAEQRALVGVSLMAAFADGQNTDAERDRIRQLIESFQNPGLNALELYREVLLKRVDVKQLTAQITSREGRLLAYEMALGVCQADGQLNAAEQGLLQQLRREWQLGEGDAAPLHQQADALTSAAVPPVLGAVATSAGARSATATADPELDSMILNNAILAGALELLPGSLATMAIIPLQMRLVYRIGEKHGHTLDRGHIGEFLAAAGIGMTSQVLEGYATKFMKGLLGTVAGGLGRGLAGAFTGSAMSFGTTWALGQLARKYYGGGRNLNALQMKESFQSLLGQAQGLQQQYLPQIQQRSRSLNLAEVVRLAGKS